MKDFAPLGTNCYLMNRPFLVRVVMGSKHEVAIGVSFVNMANNHGVILVKLFMICRSETYSL